MIITYVRKFFRICGYCYLNPEILQNIRTLVEIEIRDAKMEARTFSYWSFISKYLKNLPYLKIRREKNNLREFFDILN